MDVTSAAALNGLYKTTNNQSSVRQANQTTATDGSFDTILSNAMKMVDGKSGTTIYSCGP